MLESIAAGAAVLDAAPRFPTEAFDALHAAGVLTLTPSRPVEGSSGVAAEWQLVRSVAAADGSVGRILDGHLNAVERILVAAPPAVCRRQLERLHAERYLLGVWGGEPGPGEGKPAYLHGETARPRISGVKTFCSGAGGLDGALVNVHAGAEDPAQRLCLVHMDSTVHVDRGWFRGSGLRASESHRVTFENTPVESLIGGSGEMGREPWFSRDALRTAATWAGMADSAVAATLTDLATRRPSDELAALAAGRIDAAQRTIEAWLSSAASSVEGGEPLRALSIALRAELIRSCEVILGEAARACGSRPFALGSALDRARRDLELFTLQHRIDPMLVATGRALLASDR